MKGRPRIHVIAEEARIAKSTAAIALGIVYKCLFVYMEVGISMRGEIHRCREDVERVKCETRKMESGMGGGGDETLKR